jgi:hypothetical protein
MRLTIILGTILLAFVSSNCESDQQPSEEKTVITTTDSDGEEINIEINDKEDLFDAMHQVLDKVEREIEQKEKDNLSSDEAITYQELQDELPLMVSGMLRQNMEGDRNGIGKFQVTNAKATYETDSRYVELGITYIGGLPFAKLGEKFLRDANIVHEEEGEKAQTTTIEGFTAFEAYNEREESGSVAVFVDDRFIVHAKGEGVSERTLQKAVKKVDLKGLANW